MGRREQEHAKRVTLPRALREQVKHEQGCRCILCQGQFTERELEIHHIQPVFHHRKGDGEKANRRENLVAVCDPCHEYLDEMALTRRIYLDEIVEVPIFVQNDIEGTIDNTLIEVVLL